jgi:hypothetical protein
VKSNSAQEEKTSRFIVTYRLNELNRRRRKINFTQIQEEEKEFKTNAMLFALILIISNSALINSIHSNDGELKLEV